MNIHAVVWGSRVRSHLFPSEFAFTLTLLQWLLYYLYFKTNCHCYLFVLLYFTFSTSAFFCTTRYLVLLKNLQLLMFPFKPVSDQILLSLWDYYDDVCIICYKTDYYHRLFFLHSFLFEWTLFFRTLFFYYSITVHNVCT